MPFRLGIDAGNFARDRRGMGRFARGVARHALNDPDCSVTFLLEHARDEPALRNGFPELPLAIRPNTEARSSGRFDAVWYPWNGMRFAASAPGLVTLHDVFAFTEPAQGFVARRREQGPIRRAARMATHIATDSAFSRDEIARVLGVAPARLSVVPLAPDPFFVPGPARPPAALGASRFVLFVAGPEARKNAPFLFAVAADSLRAGEVLAIAGALGERGERALAATRPPHVRIQPGDEELRDLYRSAAVVCVPSLAEGFGLVAAEALACGAPVIASSTSSLPEAAGGAALLADPHDPVPWAHAIRCVLDDATLAESLRGRALARFPPAQRDAPARATLALLRSLAGV